jgi:hypothetical protein
MEPLSMSSVAWESPTNIVKAFKARLQKGDNRGGWTCGAIALVAQGDDTHRLPVKANLRETIGKEADDIVHVRIHERVE